MTHRCGFVAVVGAPNAGKSTIVNALVGQKVAIVSPKAQTTRTRLMGVAMDGETQIVLIDTPGIFAPTRRLDRAMVAAAWNSLDQAEAILVMIDAAAKLGERAKALPLGDPRKGPVVLGSVVDMTTVQRCNALIDDALAKGAKLVVRERLMTHGEQHAESVYLTELNGDGSSADVVSRSVARDNSYQKYTSRIVGKAECSGHTECDAILMDNARVLAVPELDAACLDAQLVHGAAIGKIAGDQLIKLMTLGLTPEEAEEQIINGFLA